jgi:hypothetical protein
MAEPQITEIASYFAERIPTEGVDHEQAKQAWRATLRYARSSGAIDPLTALVARAEPDDARLAALCRELQR